MLSTTAFRNAGNRGALIACLLASALSVRAAEETRLPAYARTKAMLTALFHHGEAPPRAGGTLIASSPPSAIAGFRERAKILEFSRSLVYEGGFFPKEIYPLMGVENAATAKIARVTRQLDRAGSRTPDPWDAAGRVRSAGREANPDDWAMAPGEAGDAEKTPGTLAYLPPLAAAYSAYPADGEAAAAQLAALKDDDLRAESVARAAVRLLMEALTSEKLDKDAWLRQAAAASGDLDSERDIRSVRVKDWRYLRGEECAMGRLERAVFLWYKGNGFAATAAEGERQLRSPEAKAYLAALAAATYGMESLPERIVLRGIGDRDLGEMIDDLQDLGVSDAILGVHPE